MTEVVSLHGKGVVGSVNHGVVQLLRELLDEAERGDVVSVAAAVLRASGNVSTRWSGNSRHEMLAGTFYLQSDLMNADKSNDNGASIL